MTEFYMPVQIYEGENCIWNHRKELALLGKKALIVTGRHSAKANGAYEDVKHALTEEGIGSILFDEVEENPSMETVIKARDMGLAANVDFVIGIGGGSPMDAAKAIALMIVHREEDASYLYKKGADSSALPVAEIPTTCGTGSEVTPYAILTNTKKNTKSSLPHRIWAKTAFFDYRYLFTASRKVLCDTAMDALGHMVESYINTNANAYSRMCVNQGLKLWAECKDVLLGNSVPQKEEYQNLLRASAMAGMAISVTGTSLPHALSYGLTCNLGMSHGKAVGYFIPGYLQEASKADRDHLLGLAGFADLDMLKEYYSKACGRDAVPQKLLKTIGKELIENEAKLKNCPYAADLDMIYRIAQVNPIDKMEL